MFIFAITEKKLTNIELRMQKSSPFVAVLDGLMGKEREKKRKTKTPEVLLPDLGKSTTKEKTKYHQLHCPDTSFL